MTDPYDLASTYRRRADECQGHARRTENAMTRMEWTALAEQWRKLADDTVLNTMVSLSASNST
jgi:hypothetical protein